MSREAQGAQNARDAQDAQDAMKRQAAEAAVAEVEDGMVLGLGTGSTAALAVEALAARVRDGLRVVGIPTSERTAAQARGLGIPLATFAEHQRIDLTIDGADEVQRGALGLIKGLGGALLWEKIVAANSARMTVMVDESKLVDRLGERCRLPVEVVPFGWQATAARLRRAGLDPALRGGDDPYRTDSGNLLLDCAMAPVADPEALEGRLKAITGVVDTGLFIGIATRVIVGTPNGPQVLQRA